MKLLNGEEISLGTCYYPEHWKEDLWEEDLPRMLANGIRTIRIAEFAWSKIEPREGEFDYSFFDRFLDLTDRMGMQVIFGTPTATPPAWLTTKYPEVLNALPILMKYWIIFVLFPTAAADLRRCRVIS